MAENIVHLVLARIAGAPEGVKGISLFIVPKFLVNADGSLGARNDVHCVSASSTSSASRRARPRCCSSATTAAPIGLPGRRGEPRPRVHVHHDERGALRGRHAGHRDRRARLPEGGGVSRKDRVQSRAGRRLDAGQRAHHPPPRRAPHADDDARLHRRLPRAGVRRRGGVRRRAPPSRRRGRASRTRPSTSSWCRWSRATAPR